MGRWQCGQGNRAWTGGIFSRRIDEVPAQLGQVNVYCSSGSGTIFLVKDGKV